MTTKVAISVFFGDEMLVVREKRSGLWGIPKGYVKVGETDHDAAVRKLREEAGIVVERLPSPPVRTRNFMLFTLRFYGERPAVTLKPETHTVESMWVRLDDIRSLPNTNASLMRWKAPRRAVPSKWRVSHSVGTCAGAGADSSTEKPRIEIPAT